MAGGGEQGAGHAVVGRADGNVAHGVQPQPEGSVGADVRARSRVDEHLHGDGLLADVAAQRVAHDVVHEHGRGGGGDGRGVGAPVSDAEPAHAAVADVDAQVRGLHVQLIVFHAHVAVGIARLHAADELGVHGGRGRQVIRGARDVQGGHAGGHDLVMGGVRAQHQVHDERCDSQDDHDEDEEHAQCHTQRSADPPCAVLSVVDVVPVAFALEWYPPHHLAALVYVVFGARKFLTPLLPPFP